MSPSVPTLTPNSSSSSLLCRASIPRTSICKNGVNKPQAVSFRRLHHTDVSLRVANERAEASTDAERSEADKIVDGMDFGELCNEFECISSPLVKSTARQLVRDILELRQGNRALGSYAVSVKYKDPVRSFTGREKYKRQLWATNALENPIVNNVGPTSSSSLNVGEIPSILTRLGRDFSATLFKNTEFSCKFQSVQQMVMLSTSVLNIKWTLRGKPKSPLFTIGGDLILKVDSKFTLNQISGQVVEHEETWDLSQSSFIAQKYFWASRRLYATVEAGKDVSDSIKDVSKDMAKQNKNVEMYPDPSGDPTKFFQRDDGFQRDLYQIALFLAVVYLVVQFLKTTL